MRQEFDLPLGYLGALRLVAFMEGRAEADVLLEALDTYFAKYGIHASQLVREPSWPPPDDASRARLQKALENIPHISGSELTPEEIAEIERDIDETVREVRAEMWERRNAASL